MNQVLTAVNTYIQQFNQVLARSGTGAATELASRPSAHSLVNALVKHAQGDLVVRHEATAGSTGRPDWTVEHEETLDVRMLVDHKGIRDGRPFSPSLREVAQLRGYLEIGVPVLVFDGIAFSRYELDRHGELVVVESAAIGVREKRNGRGYRPDPSRIEEVISLFQRSLRGEGIRVSSDDEIVRHLASFARRIRESFLHLLEIGVPDQGQTQEERLAVGEAVELQGLLYAHHDDSLRNNEHCASFVAQLLAFYMFVLEREPLFSRPTGMSVKDRAQHLRDAGLGGDDESLETSAVPVFSAVRKELMGTLSSESSVAYWHRATANFVANQVRMAGTTAPLDLHRSFEIFFRAFDPEERFDRGVFQTPSAVARWMVEFVEHIRARMAAVLHSERNVKVVDPCTGTGTFLEQYIHLAARHDNFSFVGVEILPAALALAHMRLTAAQVASGSRGLVSLHLGDALRDAPLPGSTVEKSFARLRNEMQDQAGAPLAVVIGNPPSTRFVSEGQARTQVEHLLAAYKSDGKARDNLQKAINDEAYRFLAWSVDKIRRSDGGIIALVLPNTVVARPTTARLREKLLEFFDDIWVLEFDDDLRRRVNGSSVFDVQQGRCILVANRQISSIRSESSHARVHYASILDSSRNEKMDFFAEGFDVDRFIEVNVERALGYRFDGTESTASKLWHKSWPLRSDGRSNGVFHGKCSGLKLSPVGITIHTDRDQLSRRSREFGRAEGDEALEDAVRQWSEGQKKPPGKDKFTPQVRSALGATDLDIVRYAYRPFLGTYALLDPRVITALRQAPGDGMRYRPELVEGYKTEAFGIALAPSPKDLGGQLTRFASFCHDIPDNDLVARGNAAVYPLYWADGQTLRSGGAVELNIAEPFLREWRRSGDSDLQDPKSAVHYVYAVLSSSWYLSVFGEELFGMVDASIVARVPLMSDIRARRAVAFLGARIASCESSSGNVPGESLISHWVNDTGEGNLQRATFDARAQSVTLMGHNGDLARVGGVSQKTWDLSISGYRVLDTWIKHHTPRYLNRTFTAQDAEDFADLCTRIERQSQLLGRVDVILQKHVTSDSPGGGVVPALDV